jgi:hypothetical protein
MPFEEARIEISDSKYMAETLRRQTITKFAPPRGYTNDDLTEFTLELYETQRLTKGPNLVHIHPDSGANGNVPWQDRYIAVKNYHQGDDIELWGHGQEFDRYNMWREIEEFFLENARS